MTDRDIIDVKNPNKSSNKGFFETLESYIPNSRLGIAGAFIALIGSAGTILAVPVAVFAALIGKYQLETSRRQLIITDRPWVKIKDLEQVELKVDRMNIRLFGSVRIKNVGKSPALNIKYYTQLLVPDVYVSDAEIDDLCLNGRGFDDDTQNALFPDDDTTSRMPGALIRKLRFADGEMTINEVRRRMGQRRIKLEPKSTSMYVDTFSLIVCASYDIYSDINRHYTANVYDISMKTDKSEIIDGTDAVSFDIAKARTYTQQEMVISKAENIASRAN